MRKFVEIPGNRIKKQNGRIGGDKRRSDADSTEELDLDSRITRRRNKRALQLAMQRGDFDLPVRS